MKQVTLKRLGDNEPNCPECGNANAMLHSRVYPTPETIIHYLTCRDCGYSVREDNAIIEDVECGK